MPSLPLKVQVGIRDHWTKDDSSVQKTIKGLQELLGLNVDIEPEWQLLLVELDQHYSDKGAFVAAVAGTVDVWCKCLSELLDDESNEEWAEILLEKVKSSYSRLRLFLEVSKNDQASTCWVGDRGGFVINLPKRQLSHPPELFPLFKGEIINCLNEKKSIPHHGSSAAPPAPDDWSDVGVDSRTGTVEIMDKRTPAPAKVDFLPNVNTLARPDDLLLKPPYHLSVYSRGPNEMEIQCSHSPTLQLLSEYLKRWGRVNHQISTKPPTVEIKLHQCAFGLGAMYDRLTLAAENRYGGGNYISPMIVLSLVEGVLGYEKVYSDGSTWTYRRDVEFKRL